MAQACLSLKFPKLCLLKCELLTWLLAWWCWSNETGWHCQGSERLLCIKTTGGEGVLEPPFSSLQNPHGLAGMRRSVSLHPREYHGLSTGDLSSVLCLQTEAELQATVREVLAMGRQAWDGFSCANTFYVRQCN